MEQRNQQAKDASTRLVRYLYELSLSSMALPKMEINSPQFADRLGRMIDLSYSVTLSEALRALPKVDVQRHESDSENPESLRRLFLAERRGIIEFVVTNFSGSSSFYVLPKPAPALLDDLETGFGGYQRFYALHQSELEFRVLKLRTLMRQHLMAQSTPLAQLATLDAVVADTLAGPTRKVFAVIPRLLGQYFLAQGGVYKLANQHASSYLDVDSWLKPDAWLTCFQQDMQALLLAELDTRLQPIIGLVEAFDSQSAPTTVSA